MELENIDYPVRYSQEQAEFIKYVSNKINVNGEDWFYMPFYFKQVGEDMFVTVVFDKLPDYVKEEIEKQRDGL